jgi:hypothetical protein
VSTDTAATARRIVDANMYMTLATADADGRPWASPVWYAPAGLTEFLWVSRPGTRHSQNIAGRPEIAIVIFDSTVPVGGAEALYAEAVAEQLSGDELEQGIARFSQRSVEVDGEIWEPARVTAPAQFRLYRARASSRFVLGPHDERLPVGGG